MRLDSDKNGFKRAVYQLLRMAPGDLYLPESQRLIFKMRVRMHVVLPASWVWSRRNEKMENVCVVCSREYGLE